MKKQLFFSVLTVRVCLRTVMMIMVIVCNNNNDNIGVYVMSSILGIIIQFFPISSARKLPSYLIYNWIIAWQFSLNYCLHCFSFFFQHFFNFFDIFCVLFTKQRKNNIPLSLIIEFFWILIFYRSLCLFKHF